MPDLAGHHPRSGMRLADLDAIARRNDGILRQDATDLHPDVWRRAIDAGTFGEYRERFKEAEGE